MVECAFGILANKWRIFHRPLDTNQEFSDSIIKACCVLHNFVRCNDGKQMAQNANMEEVISETNPFLSFAPSNQRSSQLAQDVRKYFAEYFTSPQGSVSWQYSFIN